MATVETTVTIAPELNSWVNPSNAGGDESGVPTGSVLFQTNAVIPAKADVDQNLLQVQMILPRNFVYRLDDWIVQLAAPTASPVRDFQTGIGVNVTQDRVGLPAVTVQGMSFTNDGLIQRKDISTGNGGGGFQTVQPYMRPAMGAFVYTMIAGGQVRLFLADVTATTTATASLRVYVSFLQYTVDAYNAWRLKTPSLTNALL